VDPSQTATATLANPDVSYNAPLAKYLVAWDTGAGNSIRGSTLSSATPPVPSGSDAEIVSAGTGALNPQIASQDYRGWSMVIFEPGGPLAATILVRPNLTFTSFVIFDSSGGGSVPSADVAHFFRGLSIAVWEDTLGGSSTDHDIWAREFLPPSMDYADFNNNGWASAFVWRPGTNAYFYYSNDLFGVAPSATSVQFGTTGDIPVRLDFNGDGIPDLAVFRPSSGFWYIDTNRNGTADVTIRFGAPGDIPAPGDYDGDGRTDVAVFRPSNGTWYIWFSATGSSIAVQFGTAGDIPVPADYNGDFRTDIAVWRPSTGFWYVNLGLGSTVSIQAQFGTAGDIPVPGDYGPSNASNAPDGMAEFAVFRPSTGTWYVSRNRDGVVDLARQFGTNGDIPVGGVYDSDPIINSPFAVFRPSNGTWYVDVDNSGTVGIASQFGTAGDVPMQQPSGQYHN
jgi:VCBS repeat protein